MEAPGATPTTATTGGAGQPSLTLVWIDAREAQIVSWNDGKAVMERLESDVPSHHKSTGHVRHDPSIRHGGGGSQQAAAETHRQEHLDRFVAQVIDRLAEAESIAIIGPGTVRERLERELRAADTRQHRTRELATAPAGRLTERQLVARVRILVGDGPPRRTAGAYRWTGDTTVTKASGAAVPEPARVTRKPPPNGKVRLADILAELQELMEPAGPESQDAE